MMLVPVHDVEHVHPDRRHPLRAILIKPELDVDEAPDLFLVRRVNFLDS